MNYYLIQAVVLRRKVQIRAFLSDVEIVGLEQDVKERAIAFRRNYRLRLPDAIITATASHLNATLMTNDTDLARVTQIEI